MGGIEINDKEQNVSYALKKKKKKKKRTKVIL